MFINLLSFLVAIVDRKTGAAIAPDNRTSSLSVSSTEQSSSSAVPASSPWSLFNSTTPDLSSTCSATSVAGSDKSRAALTATPGSVRALNRVSTVNVVASHSATPPQRMLLLSLPKKQHHVHELGHQTLHHG